MEPLSEQGCARCGDRLDVPAAVGSLCRTCRLAPPPFERAASFGLYAGTVKAAIHALKYQRVLPVAEVLGMLLAQAIASLTLGSQSSDVAADPNILVVPVPLHRTRQRERGFNQSRAIAESALRRLRVTNPELKLELAPSVLLRDRATESQAGLTSRQRRLNLRRAFKVVDAAAVHGHAILLVDDIMTTGATARAASQALLNAGAASVSVATVVRARNFAGSAFAMEKEVQERAGTQDSPQVLQAVIHQESTYASHYQSSL